MNKDIHNRLDEVLRSIDQIGDRLEALSSDSERQYNVFRTQARDTQRELREHVERARTEVTRISREIMNVSPQQRPGQQSQPQLTPDQLAWAFSQALRSVGIGGGGQQQMFQPPLQPSNSGLATS